MIEADAAAYAQLSKRRWRTALVTLAVTLPFVAAILIIEYRLMIFAIILLSAPLIAAIDAIMIGRVAKRTGHSCTLHWDATAVRLEMRLGTRVVPRSRLKMIRVQPDAVIVVEAISPRKLYGIVVPATPEQVAPLIAQFEPLGVRVQHEKQQMLAVLAILVALLFELGAGKAAVILVVAGLVKCGYWVWTGTGEPWLGLGLLAGGFAFFVLKALVAHALPRADRSANA